MVDIVILFALIFGSVPNGVFAHILVFALILGLKFSV